MHKKLFILCGEAFSGKSTLAKEIARQYGAKIVGRDEIYFALEKILALEHTPEKDDTELWDNMWPLVLQGAANHLLLNHSVVIDDNCLYLKQRDELRAVAQELGAQHILIYLNTPAGVIKKRKEENKTTQLRHDVPSAWLQEDAEMFERPMGHEDPIAYSEGDNVKDLLNA